MKKSPFSGKKVEVLLLKPLLGKGNAGDIIQVKTHYALFVLIPNQIAIIYDQQAKNQQSTQMKRIAKLKEEQQAEVVSMLETLEKNGGITFEKQATEENNLYDSISNRSLIAYLSKEFNVSLQPSNIKLEKIESLGEYTANFSYEDLNQDILIKVERVEAAVATEEVA